MPLSIEISSAVISGAELTLAMLVEAQEAIVEDWPSLISRDLADLIDLAVEYSRIDIMGQIIGLYDDGDEKDEVLERLTNSNKIFKHLVATGDANAVEFIFSKMSEESRNFLITGNHWILGLVREKKWNETETFLLNSVSPIARESLVAELGHIDLSWAIQINNLEGVQSIMGGIDQEARQDIIAYRDFRPLIEAIECSRVKIIDCLLRNLAKEDVVRVIRDSRAIMWSLDAGNVDVLKLLMDKITDVDGAPDHEIRAKIIEDEDITSIHEEQLDCVRAAINYICCADGAPDMENRLVFMEKIMSAAKSCYETDGNINVLEFAAGLFPETQCKSKVYREFAGNQLLDFVNLVKSTKALINGDMTFEKILKIREGFAEFCKQDYSTVSQNFLAANLRDDKNILKFMGVIKDGEGVKPSLRDYGDFVTDISLLQKEQIRRGEYATSKNKTQWLININQLIGGVLRARAAGLEGDLSGAASSADAGSGAGGPSTGASPTTSPIGSKLSFLEGGSATRV